MSAETTKNVEMICIMLVATATLAIHGYAFLRLDRYIQRKGHRSPFRAVGMTLGYIATAAAGFAYDAIQPSSCWSCTLAENPEYFREDVLWGHVGAFALNFVLSTTVMLALVATVAWRIPVRERRGGWREASFPWQAAAWLSFAGVPLAALVGVSGAGWVNAIKLAIFCSGLHGACSHFAKRRKAPPMDEVVAEDGRPPALYLRAFDDEGERFAMPKTSECHELGIPVRTPSSFWQSFTFDEYFSTSVAGGLGPFIALGNPHDYLPPVGASRAYLEDEGWRERFQSLARDSACILMAPSRSLNLLWELKWLRESGHHQKLFVLTSPVLPGWYGWITRARRSQRTRWTAFAADLAASGISIGAYPGEGATVGFDAQGVAIIHATAVRAPDGYVSAVQAALPTPVSGERGAPGEPQEPPALARSNG